MILIKRESASHWYLRDRTPFHEVERADGKGLRPVTLRDARKVRAYPSVTNILGVLAKPALDAWKQEQAILAALTLPREPEESLDAFAKRVVSDMGEQVEKAADLGSAIHAACEVYANSKELPENPEVAKLFAPVREWFDREIERIDCIERVVTHDEPAQPPSLHLAVADRLHAPRLRARLGVSRPHPSMIHDDTTFEQLVDAGENVCLTGPGGTGKSFRTRRLIAGNPSRFAVTASTGIAALNIGGLTLHRWSGMMLGPQNGESDEDYLDHLMADKRFSVRAGFDRIRSAETLVIDEVSMLNGRTLDFLNFLAKRVRRDDRPFGGMQMIVTGDFLQLPPVKKDPNAPYDWAFESRAWREAGFKVVHLTKVHRQEDAAFVGALSEFRFGRVDGRNARLLRARVAKFPDANLTRLFTHNAQVNKWNAYRLGEIDSEPEAFEAALSGPEHQQQFLINNLLTPQQLELKRGARVMFTVNSGEGGFLNGQTGVVTEFSYGRIIVESEGRQFAVEPFTWAYDSRDKSSATFRQFPLRLSYALTIHKSQGLTLDSAYIDVRAAREPGQAYVALSRLRELSGLHLKDWFSGVFVSRAAVEFYRNAA